MACQPCDSDPENDRKKYEQKKTEKSFEKRHTIYAVSYTHLTLPTIYSV